MEISTRGLVRLKATVQNYDWGKRGSESLVATLGYAGSGIKTVPDKPYAELWVGTHPNGPSTMLTDAGEDAGSFIEWLKQNPAALGKDENPENGLCFLFKVLSIAKALSIQAHPNKSRAEELFAERPDLYKDPNHKPELACALTEFEALLGFDRLENIVANVEATPELRDLVVQDLGESKIWNDLVSAAESTDEGIRKAALRAFFGAFMAADTKLVAARIEEFVKRLKGTGSATSPVAKKERLAEVNALALRLHDQFPYDVGVFCAFVMCYRKLQAGQAVFLAANEPHAYLSGDCVEIMANSDNVIRAALTPKFKDLPELERSLTYNEPPASGETKTWHPCQLMEGTVRDANTVVFLPGDEAVTEFQLERTIVKEEHIPYTFAVGSYGSVIFVTEGTGEAKWDQGMSRIPLFRGCAFFLPAGARVSVAGFVTLYRATKRGSA